MNYPFVNPPTNSRLLTSVRFLFDWVSLCRRRVLFSYLFISPFVSFRWEFHEKFREKDNFHQTRGEILFNFNSISKFDISTIKKILVFLLPWNGWDFFPKIVNPKFLRAQRTFPLQTRRTNWQCKYPTMRKESSSEIQPVHAQHSPSPFRHPESRIVQPHS